jgi:hypothetical protein
LTRKYCAARLAWALSPALLIMPCAAQNISQRGFIETDNELYPETAPNDSGQAVDEDLFRYEASYKALSWLRFTGSFDARFDTHLETGRSPHLDWQDRGLQRPSLSAREFNATITKDKLTAVFGKQFIRWGKADLLNPTDRFAPKDFLTVTDPDFLAVLAARVTYDTGTNSFDFVWQPRFTPSRMPLINERWTVIPPQAEGYALVDLGSQFPGRSSFGARWNHIGAGYEFSTSFYDGFNYLPDIQFNLNPLADAIEFVRTYPELRLYGTDAAIPLRWFTVKTEAAYYTSPDHEQDDYAIYVLQFERQIKELTLIGGYAGSAITERTPTLQFSPELGFARAFLMHAQYMIDTNRSVAFDTDVRQNGEGSWLRAEYSQAFGQHWRATAGYNWIRGSDNDFLGQFHRNSFALLALRYSF